MEGNMKKTKEYRHARITAIEKASGITPMSDIFEAGFDFAMAQPKHIFDGVAQVGEVIRFKDELVDVVESKGNCTGCIFKENEYSHICTHLTKCCTNLVKYIKRV